MLSAMLHAGAQGKLQEALISLGNFQSVIDEVLTWLDNANKSLDDAPPVFGDPKQIQTELWKLKVTRLHESVSIDNS